VIQRDQPRSAKITAGHQARPVLRRPRRHPAAQEQQVAIALTVIMLAYSAMKNDANFMLLYSVWNPATSSFSASGKSNGTRLVSANAAIRK
jgi:hypothetical protein